ncbi:hypothetical protein DKX38_010963 [Salix brachista]|uniref:Pentatricopeptide repeat-containing protein n=1 Tax=Salix brachista TaxID=2182728 RepID=A0A5N5LXW7_9ROSI|nr:hypothetical protein DKX38_010963 [Salix brachista]
MIDMYIKCGFLEFGRKVFYEMPKRDVISWTELISVYAKNGNMESAGKWATRLFSKHLLDPHQTNKQEKCKIFIKKEIPIIFQGKGCRSLELQAPGGRTEVEAGNAGSILTKAPPPVLPNNMSPSMMANVPSLIEEEQTSKPPCLDSIARLVPRV